MKNTKTERAVRDALIERLCFEGSQIAEIAELVDCNVNAAVNIRNEGLRIIGA